MTRMATSVPLARSAGCTQLDLAHPNLAKYVLRLSITSTHKTTNLLGIPAAPSPQPQLSFPVCSRSFFGPIVIHKGRGTLGHRKLAR